MKRVGLLLTFVLAVSGLMTRAEFAFDSRSLGRPQQGRARLRVIRPAIGMSNSGLVFAALTPKAD